MPPKYGATEDDGSTPERPPSPPGLPGDDGDAPASTSVPGGSTAAFGAGGVSGRTTTGQQQRPSSMRASRLAAASGRGGGSPPAGVSFATDVGDDGTDAPRPGAGRFVAVPGGGGDRPPRPNPSGGGGPSKAKLMWRKAVRKAALGAKVSRVLRYGDVTPHAAAAFLVHEAWGWEKGGVELDGRLLASTPSARRVYRLFHNFKWARRIPITLLLILPLIELPPWCRDGRGNECEEGPGAPTGWGVFLDFHAFHAVELVCALLIFAETYAMLELQGGAGSLREFWKLDRVFHLRFFAAGALIVDNVFSWALAHWFRLGGYLRIALFVLTVPQVRKAWYNVFAIVPRFVSVALLFASYVAFGGWLALAALSDTEEEETYSDLGTSITLMMVLLTTANNPDVWLGAYSQHRAWGIFFLTYVCFGNFYLMSLLLATIYGLYKEQAGRTVVECEQERTDCLREAFYQLDPDRRGYVDGDNARKFVEALNNHTDIPAVDPEHLPTLMSMFDEGDDGEHGVALAPAEFEVLVEQLRTKFGDIPNPALQRSGWGPVFGPLLFGRVRALRFVRTKAFGKFITAMLIMNAVVVFIEWNRKAFGFTGETEEVLYTSEGVFGVLYLIEMLLKWGGHSLMRYWRDPLNCYDGIVTIASTTVEIMLVVPNGFDNGMWLKWLIVMRILRITRLLIKVRLYKVIISTFFEILPSLSALLCAFGAIVSVYATYGVQQFGGLSYVGNPRLEGTAYKDAGYFDLNFNDFPSALVALICQCIVNNWFVLMDGYAAMTGSELSRLYFISFYFIATVFVLNLVVVVILDAAMAIIEMDTPIIPAPDQLADVDDDDDARFDADEASAREDDALDDESKLSKMVEGSNQGKDDFVADEDTTKGRAQRAILDMKSKLDAIAKHAADGSEEEEEEDAGGGALFDMGDPLFGAESPRSGGGASRQSIFDPSRARLTGGISTMGSRIRMRQHSRGGGMLMQGGSRESTKARLQRLQREADDEEEY